MSEIDINNERLRKALKRNVGYYKKGLIPIEKHIDDIFIIIRKYSKRLKKK